jgi:potassium channel subfamily K, other eukaryote
MGSYLSFAIAQPAVVIGWYVSSFILTILAIVVSSSPSDHAFAQAFYYALFAAGLHFIVATLMVVSVYGAYSGHYRRQFKLTMGQLSHDTHNRHEVLSPGRRSDLCTN